MFLHAAGVGLGAFFSPCAFPLFLTHVPQRVPAVDGGRVKVWAALMLSAAFSFGTAAFLLGLGLLIGVGGGNLVGYVSFTSPLGVTLRLVAGFILVVLGLVQTELLSVSWHGLDPLPQWVKSRLVGLPDRRPLTGSAAFGFSYPLIGFG